LDIFNNIYFVGGIHGVGKSTICKRLASELDIEYLSASEVLKWNEINTDIKNKRVNDIPNTQDRLINGLKGIILSNKRYILDGHFCLFNKDGIATKIPLETFLSINPITLTIIIGDIEEITLGLASRDKRDYSQESLKYMQDLEETYADNISNALNTPLLKFFKKDYDLHYKTLLSKLNESIT